jgi:Ion channel
MMLTAQMGDCHSPFYDSKTETKIYSFGMLTTVGYAGIVPVYPLAHTLGCGEALTGQLYLAVLVARLVSMQLSAAGKVVDESYTLK